jgi:signal transduction histidine kinase
MCRVGLQATLWRGVAVYRFAALAYAAVLTLGAYPTYIRAWLGWTVIGVMAVWSVVAAVGYAEPRRRRWPLLTADLAMAVACLLASHWVIPRTALEVGAPTLPMAWVAGAVLAWAIAGGRRLAALAAIVLGVVDMWQRGGPTTVVINGLVLLLLAGVVMGYVVTIGVDAEQRLQRATEMEAATRERERLARGIHDSVLQVLALVQRRGAELGGEAAELGRLAGEQEATLRALIGSHGRGPAPEAGSADLRTLLGALSTPRVTVSTPATPVVLTATVAAELAAAVWSALDNVQTHCGPGAHAWVLVEDETTQVTVTVRDDGPGIPAGRLAEAAAAGRLGIAQSIHGRLRDLGGEAVVTSEEGQGTEVELRVRR